MIHATRILPIAALALGLLQIAAAFCSLPIAPAGGAGASGLISLGRATIRTQNPTLPVCGASTLSSIAQGRHA